MTGVLLLAAGYVLGSLPFSLWTGKTRGVDLRQHGSGNLGATNVYRVLGWKLGVFVLLLDMAKGAAAVVLARTVAADAWGGSLPALAGLAAVAGHMFSPFVSFRGGKGVATGAGMFLALAPAAALVALGVFIAAMLFGGWVSVASCLAATVLPVAVWLLRDPGDPAAGWAQGIALVLGVLVLVRHRSNWARLRAGTEQPIWDKRPETPQGGALPAEAGEDRP